MVAGGENQVRTETWICIRSHLVTGDSQHPCFPLLTGAQGRNRTADTGIFSPRGNAKNPQDRALLAVHCRTGAAPAAAHHTAADQAAIVGALYLVLATDAHPCVGLRE